MRRCNTYMLQSMKSHFDLVQECGGHIRTAACALAQLKLNCLEQTFVTQLHRDLVRYTREDILCKEAVAAVIANAPSLFAIRSILKYLLVSHPSSESIMTVLGPAVLQFVAALDFTVHIDVKREFQALTGIFQANIPHLNVQECLCLMLNNEK